MITWRFENICIYCTEAAGRSKWLLGLAWSRRDAQNCSLSMPLNRSSRCLLGLASKLQRRSKWQLEPASEPQRRSKILFEFGSDTQGRSQWLLEPASEQQRRSKWPRCILLHGRCILLHRRCVLRHRRCGLLHRRCIMLQTCCILLHRRCVLLHRVCILQHRRCVLMHSAAFSSLSCASVAFCCTGVGAASWHCVPQRVRHVLPHCFFLLHRCCVPGVAFWCTGILLHRRCPLQRWRCVLCAPQSAACCDVIQRSKELFKIVGLCDTDSVTHHFAPLHFLHAYTRVPSSLVFVCRHIYIYIYIERENIYIYRERERERERLYIYIYIYIRTYRVPRSAQPKHHYQCQL